MFIPCEDVVSPDAVALMGKHFQYLDCPTPEAGEFFSLYQDLERKLSGTMSETLKGEMRWKDWREYLSRMQNTEFYQDPDYRRSIEMRIARCIQDIRCLLEIGFMESRLFETSPHSQKLAAASGKLALFANRGEIIKSNEILKSYTGFDIDLAQEFREITTMQPFAYYYKVKSSCVVEMLRCGLSPQVVAERMGFFHNKSMQSFVEHQTEKWHW